MAGQAPAAVDHDVIAKIREEGLTRSQVMEHLSWLTDVYGPRLTGSPQILQASDWALGKFAEWGLANPHRETFQFGRGWSLVRFNAAMVEPQVQPLIGFPAAWSPGTKGTVVAPVLRVQIDGEGDFEKYRGKLAGAIVLTQPERAVPLLEGNVVHRMGPADFAEAATDPVVEPVQRPVRTAPAPVRQPGLRRGWRSSTRTKASSPSSIAAATWLFRRSAAASRRSSSAPMAGRSFRSAPRHAPPTPGPRCRR